MNFDGFDACKSARPGVPPGGTPGFTTSATDLRWSRPVII